MHRARAWNWSKARICSQRIARGAIPLDEALPIAKQIAEALEAAHEQGIIHRDLKPANIKVRADGTVKVLDFGLAKAHGAASASAPNVVAVADDHDAGDDDRRRRDPRHGGVHGARAGAGKAVDKRADIWAFGCVLFEMLTGKAAFSGDTVTDVLAAVVKEEPRWSALSPTVPAAIRRLLRRCLEKDPRRRLQAIGDARVEIEDALQGGPAEEPLVAGSARKVPLLVWIVPTVICSPSSVRRPRCSGPSQLTLQRTGPRFSLRRASPFETPETTCRRAVLPSRPMADNWRSPARSATAAFDCGSARSTGRRRGRSKAATVPRFRSGRRTAVPSRSFALGPGKCQVKDGRAVGGLANVLCEMPGPNGSGGTWNRDNVILYGSINRGPLRRVAASGGDCVEVTRLNADTRETSHINPFFLPRRAPLSLRGHDTIERRAVSGWNLRGLARFLGTHAAGA